MPETAQIIDLGQRVSVTETRVDAHEKHLDRVDASLEKLTEVSISLKEIVKHLDSDVNNTKALFARRDVEIQNMIEQIRAEVKTEINKIETELTAEVAKVTKTVGDLKTTLTKSTSFFEKWKWVIIGGGGVVFFLFDKLPILETIVKLASSGSH